MNLNLGVRLLSMDKFLVFSENRPISVIFSNQEPKQKTFLKIPNDVEISKNIRKNDILKLIENNQSEPQNFSQKIEWKEV